MPVSTSPSDLHATVVNQAQHFPSFAWAALAANPIKANPFLPVLNKRLVAENREPSQGHLWIIIHSGENVVFIVSCTDGYMGQYPVFFFTPLSYDELHPNVINPPLLMVAEHMRRHLPLQRVYSIFAPERITRTFASMWSSITGIGIEQEPYYHAKISYLTNETFNGNNKPPIMGAVCELRPAHPGDIPAVADLAFQFAADSPPFRLTRQGAMYEAKYLINNQSLWVYTASYPGGPTVITSIVAFTRNTPDTATITKVFTHPDFRGMGCAEQLVRRVCRQLLTTRRYVVLFVGIDNRAANVYRKVGFVGLGETEHFVPNVEPWLELGFDRTHVKLGHW